MRLSRRASLLFLICIALYLTLSFALSMLAGKVSTNLYYILNALLVSIPAFLIPALLFRRREGFRRFPAPRFGHIMLAAAIGIGGIYMNAALSLLNQAIYFNVDLVSNSTTAATIAELGPIAMLIGLALVPPVSEEFIMRGTLLESWRRYGPWGAAIITSVLFALLHAAPSGIMIYFGMGMLLAIVYLITRNVWLSVTVHMVNNLSSVISALYLKYLYPAMTGGGDAAEEVSGLLDKYMDSPLGCLGLAAVYGGLACAVLIPLLFVLRAHYRRFGLGMYAPDTPPEGSRLEDEEFFSPDTGERVSMWRDPILWVAIGVLIALNVFSGLVEFGVIGQ